MSNKTFLLFTCFLSLIIAPISSSAETVHSNQQTQPQIEKVQPDPQAQVQQPIETAQPNQQVQTQLQIVTDLSEVTQKKLIVQEEIEATSKKIKELNQQIIESNANIQIKSNELNDINQKMESLKKQEKRITTLLTNRKEEFKDRVSSYYRTKGQMSFFNVLFSINSFGEFIDHFVAYDKIVNQDKKFIETYIANQNKVIDIKENVAVLQESTIKEKGELEAIKTSQVNNKKEKEALSSILEEKKKQLEKEEQEKRLALELLQENGEKILFLINNNSSIDNYDNNSNVQMIKTIITPFVLDAQKLQQEKGVPASITLGQIILESSGNYNGLSGLAFEAKNLFGIKGTGTAGSVNWDTTEYVNGQKIVINAKFARYKTYFDSMVDHANLLLTPRYQKYLKDVTSIVDYAQGILDGGYATDPNYANKLLKVIYQYNLLELDL
ncbi:glucosaminidase domain-containing protein [Neobacillus sp. PS3-40]|uniref:glucosaminidase domain-containing protein n=1 Tax=Neobacillus sp. PS3-40 TaxID=3070679 RepID=UPI0027E10CF2|nr:glucosaminidase domain-containing protein [Neobacillus sp. PS3-40]WML44824.1 glucosaminidase domain-containing protein [Neobacillus sp. PS3-40]